MTGARRGGLGRGLGALLPPATPVRPRSGDDDAIARLAPPDGEREHVAGDRAPSPDAGPDDVGLRPVDGAELREVALDAVRPNPRQPRTVFDQEALSELVQSIREVGVLQPIVVRETSPGRYELVMGERRWRAAHEAGLATMPAIVRATADEAMLRDALLENLHRQQLNPLEEAAAYQQLLAEFGVTQEELADRIGRSRPQISNTIRLLQLPPPVQRRVAAGVLSAGHARALLALDDPATQEELAARAIAEGLSVRSVEEIVSLGVAGRPARRTRGRPRAGSDPGGREAVSAAVSRLTERLDTRVKVELGRTKGRITVEFADVADLERLVAVIAGEMAAEVAG